MAPANLKGTTMAGPKKSSRDDIPADRGTLIRFANSCDRAAARATTMSASVSDLDEEDFRTIARILRKLAGS